jgi:hypothetical protein
MWTALELILFKEILDRFGIVGMNGEPGAACLESEIENTPQNIIGTVHSIELLVFEKREHDMEIHHPVPYYYLLPLITYYLDLSVLQSLLRSGRVLFTGAKPHRGAGNICRRAIYL